MKQSQAGFTLVEIAVVLVIIGLLLGGVLKGQELINSAKAKSLINDFRSVSTMVYAYQDRFRFLPGDDPKAEAHLGTGTVATTPASAQGNGRIEGAWDSATTTDESFRVWLHVRKAGLTTGTTTLTDADYMPKNAENGPIGVTGVAPFSGMAGSFFVCSGRINARFARQIDAALDDGVTNTGIVQAGTTTAGSAPTATALSPTNEGDGNVHTVCVAY
ncbi:MAG: prepilin-type N-terminal cleavage/methylation domain-containing protein [Rhodocyclaceae bacterium]|nr:prepilin-type N-terminal cleavage/methylation domain-containing protein [Rhodocyclaceae bacterium]